MITGRMIRLRPLEREDLALVAGWRNSPEVYEFMFEQEPISLAQQERWYEGVISSDDRYYFVIETIDGDPIGLVYLVQLDWRNRRAEWGFYIGELNYRMSGHAAEAELLLLQYGFHHLNLHRICCQCFAFNTKVIAMHRRFGFKEEGRLRDHVFHGGRYEDVILMGMTRDEFAHAETSLEEFFERLAERDGAE